MEASSPSVEGVVVLAARLCLGAFFLPSALGKLVNMRSFVRGMLNYQILPEVAARLFGYLLPWVELSLALMLITGVALPISGSMTAVLLISFIIAIVINLRRGRAIQCNCYDIGGMRIISWGSVARNLVLLLFAIFVGTLAPSAFSIDQWLGLLWADFATLTSLPTAILLVLLLAFGIMIVQLTEWGIDISARSVKPRRDA